MERLLALFTSIKLAISMKEVTKQEIMIQELNKRIEELNEELKRKDKDMESSMAKIRRKWDLREQEMAEFAREAKNELEVVYKSAQEKMDHLWNENQRHKKLYEEDMRGFMDATGVNKETGEGPSSKDRP